MIWDKLVDRCLLFTDAPGGLLKSLLKEAESELANKLELYDAIYTIVVPSTTSGLGITTNVTDVYADHNYTRLPINYLKDISVKHKGFNLKKITEDEIYRKSDGSIPSGTPTGYAISGDYILFNTTPAGGDKFILYYKATLDDNAKDKVLAIQHYADLSTDQIYLGTTLGSLLDGFTFQAEANTTALSNGTTAVYTLFGTTPLPDFSFTNSQSDGSSRYDVATPMTGGSGSTLSNWVGALGKMINYRSVAPLIPDRFHTSLCDYAIALANAKQSPDTYNRHWLKWEAGMDSLMSEAQDRDLIFSIREEI